MLTLPHLEISRVVRHAFFTRHGGVSEGDYASLNCGLGSRDDPVRIRENRRRAMQRVGLPEEALVTAYQVHSAKVAVVEAPWPAHARPKVDAMVTRSRGLALGILTADCAPVLMADARAGVIGAVHAGWRGAKSGILAETIAAMIELGARVGGIVAGIGPCIRQDSYEVGPEFHQALIADEVPTADLFRPSDCAGHFRFDLAGYIVRKLTVIGIESVAVLPFDTFTDADRFFSFRRAALAGGGDYGRLLSAIALG